MREESLSGTPKEGYLTGRVPVSTRLRRRGHVLRPGPVGPGFPTKTPLVLDLSTVHPVFPGPQRDDSRHSSVPPRLDPRSYRFSDPVRTPRGSLRGDRTILTPSVVEDPCRLVDVKSFTTYVFGRLEFSTRIRK